MTEINRQWVVADAAGGNGLGLSRDQFEYRETTVPEIGAGEMLVRSVYFSCDPMNHAWVKGMEERFKAIPIGQPMCGGVAGRVVTSRHPDFKPGDAITGFMEFADYVATGPIDRTGTALQRIPDGFPLASGLATLGMNGLCAYFGMGDFGHVKPGDTVVVSGAAGAIGSVAGQLARLSGARVIGIAGGAKKCALLTGDLGFDAAIDYKAEDVPSRMATLAPEGIDVFFDNVGGAILDAALANMAHGGRIVICGGIATYNSPGPGLQNHMALAMRACTMSGFFFFDYIARFGEGVKRLCALLKSGQIKEVLDIADGFDAYPDAALGQFEGRNIGKQLVRIADDPGR